MSKQDEEMIDDEDVKAEFEKTQKEKSDATSEDPSTKEKASPAASAEDVKSVTGKEQEKSDFVPYLRFKEVQDKAAKSAEYEDFFSQHGDKVRRNPISGKLELVLPDKKETVPDPLELTDDDRLAFDDQQLSVLDKYVARKVREERQKLMQEINDQEEYKKEWAGHWERAMSEFPEVKDPKSELYIRANEIVAKKYAKYDKAGNIISIEPRSQYLAVLEADRELRKEAQQKEKSETEEKKNQQQNSFVEKKSAKAPTKTAPSDKDFEKMSEEEQLSEMEKEFDKRKEKITN